MDLFLWRPGAYARPSIGESIVSGSHGGPFRPLCCGACLGTVPVLEFLRQLCHPLAGEVAALGAVPRSTTLALRFS